MRYRRYYMAGGSYFFTVVAFKRKPIFNEASIALLRESFRWVKGNHPFEIDAAVILPDHLHCIWTLPENDADFSVRWQLIKTRFTRLFRKNDAQHKVWQPRFWEHYLRDQQDFNHHVDYIHNNPVKHGYVCNPRDWPWSTIHHSK